MQEAENVGFLRGALKMKYHFKKGILACALVLACYGSVVTAKNNADQSSASQRNLVATAIQKNFTGEMKGKYCCSGFLFNKTNAPESGSFVLFISGVLSMIGIGWVRKKKS